MSRSLDLAHADVWELEELMGATVSMVVADGIVYGDLTGARVRPYAESTKHLPLWTHLRIGGEWSEVCADNDLEGGGAIRYIASDRHITVGCLESDDVGRRVIVIDLTHMNGTVVERYRQGTLTSYSESFTSTDGVRKCLVGIDGVEDYLDTDTGVVVPA